MQEEEDEDAHDDDDDDVLADEHDNGYDDAAFDQTPHRGSHPHDASFLKRKCGNSLGRTVLCDMCLATIEIPVAQR